MGANTAATTDGTFETDVLKSDIPVLVDFWADIDNNREMTEKFGVRGIPTMILFKGGEQVNHMVGNRSKEEIVSFISSAL